MYTTSFNDNVVVVTGGNSGIGAAVVAEFLQAGARVAVLDIRPPVDPAAIASSQRLDITCDIGDETAAEGAIAQVLEKFGTIDVLCNVAGVMDAMARPSECLTSTWERCFRVNVHGPFYLIRAVTKVFLSKPLAPGVPQANQADPSVVQSSVPPSTRGCIVNVCSTASQTGAHAGAAYTASKHAVLGLSRSTAWMYAKEGIRCNAVLPGGVQTNIVVNSGVAADVATAVGMGAVAPVHATMPGFAEARDVAGAVLMLAGNQSINGAEVSVDRGWAVI